ncbi:hypothetical protein Hrd1104_02410 [Halorhabdus sp. CBA1104]|uniref:DUF5781 family protein n=1 Tax=unclassified Halorhabdus TaxID=2621901 RepID=UPI0012B394FE|nr:MULTISPECIES: DUF5781 family protein [unclassified Halorhabdus]QGN06254.1 hypothetical protein Hrd1104_02410 [Halorhabdus sp. CBA1104]
MELVVEGPGPAEPFYGARDIFESEYGLNQPVSVSIHRDPDERTRVSHGSDGHILSISQQAATSVMARELTLHEFAHMHQHEQRHPSHTLSTDEIIFLALAGRSVERRTLTQCYQIINHARDIYADDVWIDVSPTAKLARFFESGLAGALIDRPSEPVGWERSSGSDDPEITAVNAAFAVALVERHGLADPDHRIYDLAQAAATDAPNLGFEYFREQFRDLSTDPTESEFRSALVELTQTYVTQVRCRPDQSAGAD